MSDNPQASAPQAPFFAVSEAKLLVLSIFTLNIYQVYWAYQHWSRIRAEEQSKIYPFWRAVFGIFFCYPLFTRIGNRSQGVTGTAIAAGSLALGWVLLGLLWKLPDPYWLINYAAVLCLLPIQRAANQVNAAIAPDHEPNAHFGKWDIVLIVLGTVVWTMALFGMFYPE